MNKICTTIEQSQKLIELGIDVNTADMEYMFLKRDGSKVSNIPFVKDDDEPEWPNDSSYDFIPCWSLTALLELMPPYLFEFERGIDLNIYRNLNGKGWHVSYMPNNIEDMKKDKFRQITNGDNPIDAAFEMVCWLLENKNL